MNVFTTEAGGDGATSYSRLLPLIGAFREDPATGSTGGLAGCFMVKYGVCCVRKRRRLR